MEDRHVIAENLGGDATMSLLAVFDGHRGAAAAEYAASHMLPALRQNWDYHGPAALLRRTFVGLDADFRRLEAAEYAARVQRMGEGSAGAALSVLRHMGLLSHYCHHKADCPSVQ